MGSGSFGSAFENAFETAIEPMYNGEEREAREYMQRTSSVSIESQGGLAHVQREGLEVRWKCA
jgi:hypothetical protein